MKWLVTAFEPFGGSSTNSSQIVVRALKLKNWGGQIEFLEDVPVDFKRAWPYVLSHLDASFTGVMALGQAENRQRVGLERVALNWIDARIADNSGYLPAQGAITGGEELLWSPIPWEKLEDSTHRERSYSAGTYVCNTLMYQSVSWARSNGKWAGFVHVPLLSSQVPTAALSDVEGVKAVERILQFVLEEMG